MATSIIIENIRVNNPRVLEEYVAAMEEAAKKPLSFSFRLQITLPAIADNSRHSNTGYLRLRRPLRDK